MHDTRFESCKRSKRVCGRKRVLTVYSGFGRRDGGRRTLRKEGKEGEGRRKVGPQAKILATAMGVLPRTLAAC